LRLGVLADSHDHLDFLEKAVDLFRQRQVQAVVHAGDFVAPFTVPVLGQAGCKVYGVYGNNDGERVLLQRRFAEIGGELHERPHEFELGGQRVLVLHEPVGLEGLARAGTWALVVYGHTHQVDLREGPTVILNPGEVCGWLTGRATAAVVELPQGWVEVVELGRR
jgi:putative phosphoesterase